MGHGPGSGDDEGWRVMGRRRTTWGRARGRPGRRPCPPRYARVAVVAAVLCAVTVLPGGAALAAGATPGSATFGSRSPHPIAAWGERDAATSDSSCEGAGTYYVVVERVDRSGSSPDAW